MSLRRAEIYARRARKATTVKEVGDNTCLAILQLTKVIRAVERRVRRLEAKIR